MNKVIKTSLSLLILQIYPSRTNGKLLSLDPPGSVQINIT